MTDLEKVLTVKAFVYKLRHIRITEEIGNVFGMPHYIIEEMKKVRNNGDEEASKEWWEYLSKFQKELEKEMLEKHRVMVYRDYPRGI